MSVEGVETIVVGIDNSEGSWHALEWAVGEARRSNRDVTLVHVWHWSTDAVGAPVGWVGVPDARKAGRAVLARAGAYAKQHGIHAWTHLVEDSSPVSGLVGAADGAAMLVVGSHGRGAFVKAFLGSVSHGCAQHAPCPVVVIPAHSVVTVPQPAAAPSHV